MKDGRKQVKKGREGKGREGKGREGKGRKEGREEGKEGKGREGKEGRKVKTQDEPHINS